MILAAALWWVYFDSAAEINLKVLELSGGSPTMARAIFAVGHMLPAFALLITAAGVGLLLEGDPPHIASWLACVGIGIYLARHPRVPAGRRAACAGSSRALLLVATFQLGRLQPALGAARVHVAARRVGRDVRRPRRTRTARGDEHAGDLDRYLGGRREGVDARRLTVRCPAALSRRTARARRGAGAAAGATCSFDGEEREVQDRRRERDDRGRQRCGDPVQDGRAASLNAMPTTAKTMYTAMSMSAMRTIVPKTCQP